MFTESSEKLKKSMNTKDYMINTKLARSLQCIGHTANYGGT